MNDSLILFKLIYYALLLILLGTFWAFVNPLGHVLGNGVTSLFLTIAVLL
jgi:hypothetical protein